MQNKINFIWKRYEESYEKAQNTADVLSNFIISHFTFVLPKNHFRSAFERV